MTMRLPRCAILSALMLGLLPVLLLTGCGDGLPPRVPVSGTVTINGQPATHGTVTFYPVDEESGHYASGPINEQGQYTLTTNMQSPEDGAVPGEYKVGLDIRRKPKNEMDTLPPLLIPEKYTMPQSTDITKEVTSGEPNTIDIDVPAAR